MEPGWYRNPKEPGVVRYWDGSEWSESKKSPDSRKSTRSRGSALMKAVVAALSIACLAVATLFITTLSTDKANPNAEPGPTTAAPKKFESVTKMIFGQRGTTDVSKLTGIPASLVLSEDLDIILGLGHNILDYQENDESPVISKAYWSIVFITSDPPDVFKENMDRKFRGAGLETSSGIPSTDSTTYRGLKLDGYTTSYPSTDDKVSSVEVSYYEIDSDDTLVVLKTLPGKESVVLTEESRGSSSTWTSEVASAARWSLAGTALQPRLDSVEFSGATHTATGTFKIPASEFDTELDRIKSGEALKEFANISKKQGRKVGADDVTVFFRAGTEITVLAAKPGPGDTEATIIVSFDVKAP